MTILGSVAAGIGALSGWAFRRIGRAINLDEGTASSSSGSSHDFNFFSLDLQGQPSCLVLVLTLMTGVSVTLQENFTVILRDSFHLSYREIGILTFLGIGACLTTSALSSGLDSVGG